MCSNSTAVKQLKANGWNLEATLNQYFNDSAVVIDGDEGGESADALFDRYKSAPPPRPALAASFHAAPLQRSRGNAEACGAPRARTRARENTKQAMQAMQGLGARMQARRTAT